MRIGEGVTKSLASDKASPARRSHKDNRIQPHRFEVTYEMQRNTISRAALLLLRFRCQGKCSCH